MRELGDVPYRRWISVVFRLSECGTGREFVMHFLGS